MKKSNIRRLLERASACELPVQVERDDHITTGYVWSVGDEHFELVEHGHIAGFGYGTVDWVGLAL